MDQKKSKQNPRRQNGNLRRKYRARFKAMQAPCHICCGRLGEIHYDEPSDPQHPLSLVIDEIIPVSKWKAGGFSSPRECAETWSNLSAAHRICNQMKGNKLNYNFAEDQRKREEKKINKKIIIDGKW